MLESAETGKLIAGRYRLEHQVGEGGMATVWVAEDEKLERWVALKLLGKNYLSSRSVRQRFEREAMAIAKLRSPHVVQVFDHGTDVSADGTQVVYIAMELLSGQDLYTWLKHNRPVPLAQVARIISQVARGLTVAHRAGIVHRDLKPSNVFVVRDHDEDTVKVFDFGLARGFRDHSQLRELRDRTGEGVLLGTPRYMSPEQAHGARTVDHRADLWSLAVIAYLAVTSRLPFDGTGVGEVVTKINTEEPAPPSELVAGLSSEVDAFFARALSKDPDARFQSAADLALAFDEVVGSGRTSSALIGERDGDTEVELGSDDTFVSDEPSSADAPTLLREEGPRTDEPTTMDRTVVESKPSRSILAAGLVFAAALAVLAASYKYERAQSAGGMRVPAPGTRLTSKATDGPAPSRNGELADSEPRDSERRDDPADSEKVDSEPVDGAAGRPTISPASPPGSASSEVSERGLELFDDRH